MKKLFQRYGGFLAALAIVVTTMNANAVELSRNVQSENTQNL